MTIEKRTHNERLVEQVKALGQDIIDRAEDLVGSGNLITAIDIRLQFAHDDLPTIEVTRSHASQRYLDILNKRDSGTYGVLTASPLPENKRLITNGFRWSDMKKIHKDRM